MPNEPLARRTCLRLRAFSTAALASVLALYSADNLPAVSVEETAPDAPRKQAENQPHSSDGHQPTAQTSWVPRRPEFERIAEKLANSTRRGHGTVNVQALLDQLGQPGLSAPERIDLLVRLTKASLGTGQTDKALLTINQAMDLIDMSAKTEAVANLYKHRALVYLRKAEVENCIERRDAACDIVPLRNGGIHLKQEFTIQARRDYEKALEITPSDLRSLWLLNIVYMALGLYPDQVPSRFRYPPTAFASDYDIGRFENIAPQLGLDTFNLNGGTIMEDFDNDGFLDIVTSTSDPWGPLTFYRNLGNGDFADRSASSRTDDQLGGLNCVAADYDNDGYRDVLVLRGAWWLEDGQIRNSLLRNESGESFRDVTHRAGLALPARPTQAAAWGDFDNDGELDLYIANESSADWEGEGGDFPSQLFRNNGDGTFTGVAGKAGVTNDRYGKGVAVGDYDNDGDLDIYVSNIGVNRLYRNDGDLKFTDVAESLGVTEPARRSFAAWFFDYDNDGWLDLFVAAFEAFVADVAADMLDLPNRGKKPRLYRNNGNGTFSDVTEKMGLDHVYLPMGANFGDLDNDGFLDIYLGTGEPDFRALVPNAMLRNDRGRRYQDVTTAGRFGHLQKGHGIAFGDIDNDGDQDVYHQLGGHYPGDRYYNVLFSNPGHGNRYLVVKLVGTRSNRDAVGARIKVVVEHDGEVREIHRAVGSVSSFGGSPIRQEIGLGKATAVRRVEVYWPASKSRSVVRGVPLDSVIQMTEGKEGFEKLELRCAPLPGTSCRKHPADPAEEKEIE
jgi:tetratricopeptide (TPR) repeat protein